MRSSKRILRGSKRLIRRELFFGMKKKIWYRTAFEPVVITYSILVFLIISLIAIIQGSYSHVPVIFYILTLIGFIVVEAYALGRKNFDP